MRMLLACTFQAFKTLILPKGNKNSGIKGKVLHMPQEINLETFWKQHINGSSSLIKVVLNK